MIMAQNSYSRSQTISPFLLLSKQPSEGRAELLRGMISQVWVLESFPYAQTFVLLKEPICLCNWRETSLTPKRFSLISLCIPGPAVHGLCIKGPGSGTARHVWCSGINVTWCPCTLEGSRCASQLDGQREAINIVVTSKKERMGRRQAGEAGSIGTVSEP